MSDPVTQVEIEDVLTSIRRLVSENGRAPQPDVEPEENHPDDAINEAADRLVLTPALRVSEMKVDAAQDDVQSIEIEEKALENWSFSSRVSAIEPEQQEPEADVDADIVETAILSGPVDESEVEAAFGALELPVENENEPQLATTEDDDSEDHDEGSEDFDEDEGIALSEAQALDSRIVQWGRLGTGDDLPYEPDVPGDSDYAGTDVEALNWTSSATVAEDDSETDDDDLAALDLAEPVADDFASDEGQEYVEAEITEIEETHWQDAVEEETGEPEFEAGSADLEEDSAEDGEIEDAIPVFVPGAFRHASPESVQDEIAEDVGRIETTAEASEDVMDYGAQIEAQANDYIEETFEEAVAPELDGFDPDDTAFLDEAMMRDLVGEIVRQELQGALGERITRNVRKLVRREIHRALAAHDLE